jgi:cytosine deaminase
MLILRSAKVPVSLLPAGFTDEPIDPIEPLFSCDIMIADGKIALVTRPGSTAPSWARIKDLSGAVVFPAFVDSHVHLDKTHTWHRAPNRTGTFLGALESLHQDHALWTREDLLKRADFALRCAWAHGTRAIRTHVDTGPEGSEVSHATMAELRANWAGKIELQTVPLTGLSHYATPAGEKIAEMALKYGASALGGWAPMSADLAQWLDPLMALAAARGVGLDFHVDETGDPAAEVLRTVAEAVLRNEFKGPVVCGHCCSLSVQDPARRKDTIRLVAEAKINVISLPLCNLYLQDRRGKEYPRSPHWRGLAPLQDLMDAGVPVACASDNVRDAFFAYGDYDMGEVYSQAVRIGHLDSNLADSPKVVTATAGAVIGLPQYGRIEPGAEARLIIFAAESFSDLLSRPAGKRQIVDGETIHTPELPDYWDLA